MLDFITYFLDTPQYYGRSEKSCVENLFKRDSLVRESQLIIDWLESCAADKDDEVLTFSDSSLGWENTLHQLESSENIAFRSTRPIVNQMDPDAPHRQKKSLHDLDMEDEKRLSRKVFNEIRCGKLEEAQKVKLWKLEISYCLRGVNLALQTKWSCLEGGLVRRLAIVPRSEYQGGRPN